MQCSLLEVRVHEKLLFGLKSFLSDNGGRQPRATFEFQFTTKQRTEVGDQCGRSGYGDTRNDSCKDKGAANKGHGLV